MSNIEWTDETWNPVTGCTKVSAGCKNCYAERMAHRLRAMGKKRYANGFNVTLHEDLLDLPKRWKKPRMVFVNSMSDLFHEDVPFGFTDRVFDTMCECPRHTFQVLTKRPGRMLHYCDTGSPFGPNVWLGSSAENQGLLDERAPFVCDLPASVRWLSCEPLLEPIDLTPWLHRLDWIIVGGESGPGARPMQIEWVIKVVAQCRAAGVPCFVKQLGPKPTFRGSPWPGFKHNGIRGKGGDMTQWPPDLRVREFPSGNS